MRVRSSFVSNSSTCSFILLGFELDKKQYSSIEVAERVYGLELLEKTSSDSDYLSESKPWQQCNDDEKREVIREIEYECDHEISIIDDNESGAPDGSILVGKSTSHNEEDGTRVMAVESIIDDLKELQRTFPGEQIKIVLGTMMC